MRSALVLLALATTACAATTEPPRSGAALTVERRNTGVVLERNESRSLDLPVQVALETKSYPVAAAAEDVWRVLPQAYAEVGVALAAYDSARMTLGNPGLAIRGGRLGGRRASAYLNCGTDPLSGPVADRSDIRLSVVSQVRTAQGVSVIDTQVWGEATQRGNSASRVRCTSTGALEDALARATRLRILQGA